eukprot:gnl/MRDRNA2_/MRDRNA2_31589_c0_seq1.p1 gnl/MRDRNA2_/MRDRNA2_31589_c0~~gnl/MRDRNA2_/MRDRNA2_31589_c0_seq1.p1  ORF type:complete len:769 (-),score=152.99 gnl/MRDRNA2_/MRDRNA2_31589_c0_seq1:48-2354(-)
MVVILKIKCDGDIYRALLQGPAFTYEDVKEALDKAAGQVGNTSSYKAKYLDEEGDLCVVCAATFSDFFATACYQTKGRKVYKLEMFFDAGSVTDKKVSSEGYMNLRSGDAVSLKLDSHPGQGLVPEYHGRHSKHTHSQKTNNGVIEVEGHQRTFVLWRLKLGSADDACVLRLEGPPDDCRLRWVKDNLALEVSHRQMEAGSKIWLWNDEPAVPICSHSRFHINADGTISPNASTPGAKGGYAKDFVLGLKGDHVVLVPRSDSQNRFVFNLQKVNVPEDSAKVDSKIASACHPARKECHPPQVDKNRLWWLHPRKLVWLLSQLRASGALKSDVLAAMAVQAVSEILQGTKSEDEIVAMINEHLPHEKGLALIKILKEFVVNKAGFERCETKFDEFIHGAGTTSGEAILELLKKVQCLEFDSQVLFFMHVFKSQEGRLHHILNEVDARLPDALKIKVEHVNVICDGCEAHPIVGPRFKCKGQDYDLCGTCYAKRTTKHDHEELKKQYEMYALDYRSAAFRKLLQARRDMHAQEWWQPSVSGAQANKPCAGGCGYTTTWHPTHCCNACLKTGGRAHGPKCEGKLWAAKDEAKEVQADEASKNDSSQTNGPIVTPTFQGPEPEPSPVSFDHSYPVEVEDGRHLVLNWNIGDEPEKVAQDFAQAHGLSMELSEIIGFIYHANQISQVQEVKDDIKDSQMPEVKDDVKDSQFGGEDAQTPELKPDADKEDFSAGVQQLMEIGFGQFCSPEELEALLVDSGGDVEKVVRDLLQLS